MYYSTIKSLDQNECQFRHSHPCMVAIGPIIRLLATAIQPSKIYALRHTHRDIPGSMQHISLLLIIPNRTKATFEDLKPILNIIYATNQEISCSLHNEGTVIQCLRQGHIFFSLNCISNNIVFDDCAIEYPYLTNEQLEPIRQQALQIFLNSHAKALDFYDCALNLSGKHSTAITLFLLHQSVEIVYRGLLQSLNGFSKKTHEIRVLQKYAQRCVCRINEVFPCTSPEDLRLREILDEAYSRARYEENYCVEDNELDALFKKVKMLLSYSKKSVISYLNL